MSNVKFLDKLLDGVLVEWKALGEVAKYSDVRIDSNQVNKKNYVGVDNLLQNGAGKADSNYVPTEGRHIEYRSGDVLIGNIRPYLKKIWLADQAGGTNGDVLVIRSTHPSLSSGYLHQVLMDDKFFAYNMQHARGAKMPRGDKAKILEYCIPIPCPNNPEKSLEIQAKIVSILHTFTELTNELTNVLTNELTNRKKQYNHYRDQLLSFEDGDVEWKTLGEVLSMRAGQHISASKIMSTAGDDHVYPCFGGNGVRGYVREKSHDGEYLLIGRQGALCGNVQRFKGQFYATEHAVVAAVHDDINVDWAFHMLTLMNLNQYASQSAQPGLAVGKLESLKIPVPSIVEQMRIAAILDKFDALTTSLTEGLPREIELRQKQYAYYRDLLLNFPRPEALEV